MPSSLLSGRGLAGVGDYARVRGCHLDWPASSRTPSIGFDPAVLSHESLSFVNEFIGPASVAGRRCAPRQKDFNG